MIASPKLRELLQTLTRATFEGRANWNKGSRDDTFVWSGSNASVILLTKDNDGAAPYIVRLADAEGRIIESVATMPGGDDTRIAGELYAAARADALDINATIEGLLDDLS